MDPAVRIVELEAENAQLRELSVVLAERVRVFEEQLSAVMGKVADLEKLLGRNSSNSSKPPSADPGTAKTARPENANRAARRALARKQGKQPGAPGATLSQVTDPDVVVTQHALYLLCAQHLPRERCAQTAAHLFGVTVSTGTLDNWIREAAEALVGFGAIHHHLRNLFTPTGAWLPTPTS